MKTYAAWMFAGLFLTPIAAHAAEAGRFYGTWRIDSIAGYADISEGDAEAKKLIGKTIQIAASSSTIAGELCRNPTTMESVEVDHLLSDEWKTSRQDIKLGKFKLGNSAQHINSGCAESIVLSRDELLVDNAGAFYLASRQR